MQRLTVAMKIRIKAPHHNTKSPLQKLFTPMDPIGDPEAYLYIALPCA